MKIIGIIGKVASGKTSFTKMLKYFSRATAFVADDFVHRLYTKNSFVVGQIHSVVPECVIYSKINHEILRDRILSDRSLLSKIEKIVYPVVDLKIQDIVKSCLRRKVKLLVLDVPLLNKINSYRICKKILCAHVNKVIWQQRIKNRNLTENKLLSLVASRDSSYIHIQSGIERRNLYNQIKSLKL